jgi:hypothetical protein
MKLRHSLLFCALVASSSFGAQGELVERRTISSTVEHSLLSGHFDPLEEMSSGYRSTKSRTSSGLWNLTLFYAGIGAAIESAGQHGDRGFADLETKILKWAEQYPLSPAAHLAHSSLLISRAWAIRGDGLAVRVRPEAWAPFRRYVARARKHLEKHKSVASVDPHWYEVMLQVARAQNWDRDRFDRLVDEALEREPLFYQTYFQALEYLLPKWHGDVLEIEKFALAAVERTSKEEGNGMYARIYWYASQTHFEYAMFRDSLVVWPRMKAGFEDIIARHPDAWNLNNYAKFSCVAIDKPKTHELLQRVQADIVFEAWPSTEAFQRCTDWASKP